MGHRERFFHPSFQFSSLEKFSLFSTLDVETKAEETVVDKRKEDVLVRIDREKIDVELDVTNDGQSVNSKSQKVVQTTNLEENNDHNQNEILSDSKSSRISNKGKEEKTNVDGIIEGDRIQGTGGTVLTDLQQVNNLVIQSELSPVQIAIKRKQSKSTPVNNNHHIDDKKVENESRTDNKKQRKHPLGKSTFTMEKVRCIFNTLGNFYVT